MVWDNFGLKLEIVSKACWLCQVFHLILLEYVQWSKCMHSITTLKCIASWWHDLKDPSLEFLFWKDPQTQINTIHTRLVSCGQIGPEAIFRSMILYRYYYCARWHHPKSSPLMQKTLLFLEKSHERRRWSVFRCALLPGKRLELYRSESSAYITRVGALSMVPRNLILKSLDQF